MGFYMGFMGFYMGFMGFFMGFYRILTLGLMIFGFYIGSCSMAFICVSYQALHVLLMDVDGC